MGKVKVMYNTPQLLLVGSAQRLVLGDSLRDEGSIVCNAPGGENDVPEEVNDAYLDQPSW
jgi:hypothetical protein